MSVYYHVVHYQPVLLYHPLHPQSHNPCWLFCSSVQYDPTPPVYHQPRQSIIPLLPRLELLHQFRTSLQLTRTGLPPSTSSQAARVTPTCQRWQQKLPEIAKVCRQTLPCVKHMSICTCCTVQMMNGEHYRQHSTHPGISQLVQVDGSNIYKVKSKCMKICTMWTPEVLRYRSDSFCPANTPYNCNFNSNCMKALHTQMWSGYFLWFF